MVNKPFVIDGHSVAAGTRQTLHFPAPSLHTQVDLKIPVHVFHGKFPGPRLFLIGTIHGDEVNSIEILRRVYRHIKVSQLHGTVVIIPVANVYGLLTGSRYLPDRRDLNRSFPGGESGSLANRLAHDLMSIVSTCDYGIDLHTGSLGHLNIPQLRVNLATPGVKALAYAFDAPVVMDAELRDGSLRQVMSDAGIPLLVYEGGEALRFNELCIRAGVKGILNVMAHLRMLRGVQKSQKQYKSLFAHTSRWARAKVSGFVQHVGDNIARTVKKGDLLAYIHDPFLVNPAVKVLAPFDGIVIGLGLSPLVSEGDALFHVASFKRVNGLEETIEEYKDDLINS